MEGVRTVGGVGWRLGKNEQLEDRGSGVSTLTPAPTGAALLSPILNIVVLPKTSLGGGGEEKYKNHSLLSECCHFSPLLADTQDGKGSTTGNGETQKTLKI